MHKSKHGFTLLEAIGALAMVAVGLGLALAGYMYMLKNTNESDIQSELDINVQQAMERLKMDLRLSSLDKIFYYPEGPGPYTALSFPMAEDDDGDGLFELDSSGMIVWDKTVIYHIWPSSPHELRVTTFKNRDNSLNDSQRQQQLVNVVKSGGGNFSGIPNAGNASSITIFKNLLEWSIKPQQGIYDAYSPISEREKVSLGFALIDNGAHKYEFKVAGKNDKASGYKIGVDQLKVSPSYGMREAEAQTVTTQAGSAASAQYMTTGSWQGNHQLYFPATAPGHSFTLSMSNDRWEETNFNGDGYIKQDTDVVFDETFAPRDFVVQLDGMDDTWNAAAQTGDEEEGHDTGGLKDRAIRILQKGAELSDGGNWFNYNGKKCRITFAAASGEPLKLYNTYIGQSSSSTNASMDYMNTSAAPMVKVKFGGVANITIPAGETRTSDWIDLPIDRDKNYLVSFRIANNGSLDGAKQWVDRNATDPLHPSPLTTMVVDDASGPIAKDASWSDRSDITPYMTNRVFALEGIEASYPEKGTYTSQIYDTRLDNPKYGRFYWNSDLPTSDTTLAFKVRSGARPDLSDAPDFDTLSAYAVPLTVSSYEPYLSEKRYVQFQALMASSEDGTDTPSLKDIALEWTGEKALVNIEGVFTKGPDYGIVEVLVDGMPLQSALTVDLMIYTEIRGMKNKMKRVTSSLISDIRPRNTGR